MFPIPFGITTRVGTDASFPLALVSLDWNALTPSSFKSSPLSPNHLNLTFTKSSPPGLSGEMLASFVPPPSVFLGSLFPLLKFAPILPARGSCKSTKIFAVPKPTPAPIAPCPAFCNNAKTNPPLPSPPLPSPLLPAPPRPSPPLLSPPPPPPPRPPKDRQTFAVETFLKTIHPSMSFCKVIMS